MGRGRSAVPPRPPRVPLGCRSTGARPSHVGAALRRFQAWAGLGADGVAGAATLGALRRPPPRSVLRFARPIGTGVGDGYGPRGAAFHTGLDFPAADRHAGGRRGLRLRRVRRAHVGRLRQARGRAPPAGDDQLVRAPVPHRRPPGRVRRGRRPDRARRLQRALDRPAPALRAAPSRRRRRPARRPQARPTPTASRSPRARRSTGRSGRGSGRGSARARAGDRSCGRCAPAAGRTRPS